MNLPYRRRLSLALWLGGAVALASPLVAFLALRSHAGDSSPRSAAPESPRAERGVAVGHVDVEHGVTPVSAVQPGRVTKVVAEEGKPVASGGTLFTLDNTVASFQVDEAKTAVDAAKVQQAQAQTLAAQHREQVAAQRQAIDAARADADLARSQRDKVRRRFENKTDGSAEDVESANAAVRKAEAGVKAEEAKLARLEAMNPQLAVDLAAKDVAAKETQLKKAEHALKECTVRAPFDGTPLRILVSEGEVHGPTARQPALYFCPNGPRIVRAEVEQEFAGRVAVGQDANIQDDATGGGQWRGKVHRVSDWYSQRRSILLEPLQFNDVRTLECIIRLNPDQPPLRIGQRVRVTMQ